MIMESLSGVHKDVDDLYGDQFTVALARAAATLECAPYWHSGEKAPSRLARAQELVRHSRVILQDERLAIVHGLIGHALERDQEDYQDSRATAFLALFTQGLVGKALGAVVGGSPPKGKGGG